jgi:hypothetical protein
VSLYAVLSFQFFLISKSKFPKKTCNAIIGTNIVDISNTVQEGTDKKAVQSGLEQIKSRTELKSISSPPAEFPLHLLRKRP